MQLNIKDSKGANDANEKPRSLELVDNVDGAELAESVMNKNPFIPVAAVPRREAARISRRE
jgi:hypothetical protein